jgi:hypothetical protein
MKLFSQVWNNFKTQPDVWFFYGFLITFTLSIRKVLFFYPIGGQFNEWTGAYLYLSDIFLSLTLIIWTTIILHNDNIKLSIVSTKLWLKKATILLPLILITWSFTSILWAENQNIALFRAIKLLEFYLLYLYVIYRIIPPPKECSSWNILRGKHGTFLKHVFRIIIALGFIQALIGISQFIIQHSIGVFWLKESLISPNIDGVAKIMFHGDKFIRTYGLFQHPNILGGFLLVSVIMTWAYFNSFHSKQISQLTEKSKNLIRETTIFRSLDKPACRQAQLRMTLLIAIQIIALILTFSKSAILAFVISFGYIWLKNKDLFHMKQIFGKLITGLIILILGLYSLGLNFGENLEKSYGDRLSQFEIWKSTTQDGDILFGSGIGSYMFHVKHMFPNLIAWQYQPIHNVYLLILAELGFVGLFVFALFLLKLLKADRNVPPQKECSTPEGMFHMEHLTGQAWNILRGRHETFLFKGILFGFIFIMLFDHYLWDIQQGQIMLWLILGFLAGFQLQNQIPQSNSK